MSGNQSTPLYYVAFCVVTILVLKEVNSTVWDPYMDEPFHVPQAQAYCEGKWDVWDPKITTPPGLYLATALLRNIFMFKCRLPLLRLVPALHLLSLPVLFTNLEAYHQRLPPPDDLTSPTISSVALASFPPLWFFGFMFYTDVPGIAFVLAAFVAQANGSNWLAALLGLWSLFFRQTNIIWIIYIFAYYQVFRIRWQRPNSNGGPQTKLYDPPASEASFADLFKSLLSLPRILPSFLLDFLPYGLICAMFAGFIVWNGGIVLGDKSNHIPGLHIPQLFYFYAFSTLFGLPVLMLSGVGSAAGPLGLVKEVAVRMGLLGEKEKRLRRLAISVVCSLAIAICVHLFTIHHPFVLSDNRHYVFYIWKRILFRHPAVSYLLAPVYLACWWAWWIRVGATQSLLQTLILPLSLIPTLVPSPLLEPRYFIVPYILLRLQVPPYDPGEAPIPPSWQEEINKSRGKSAKTDPKTHPRQKDLGPATPAATAKTPVAGLDWANVLPWVELVWYGLINYATMYVFLYKQRGEGESVIRFMW